MIPGKPIKSDRTRTFRTVTVRMPVSTHNKLLQIRDVQKQPINTTILKAIDKYLGKHNDNS